MTARVLFIIDETNDTYELKDVPVPAVGAKVQFDRKTYVVRSVTDAYRSIDGGQTLVDVQLSSESNSG